MGDENNGSKLRPYSLSIVLGLLCGFFMSSVLAGFITGGLSVGAAIARNEFLPVILAASFPILLAWNAARKGYTPITFKLLPFLSTAFGVLLLLGLLYLPRR